MFIVAVYWRVKIINNSRRSIVKITGFISGVDNFFVAVKNSNIIILERFEILKETAVIKNLIAGIIHCIADVIGNNLTVST